MTELRERMTGETLTPLGALVFILTRTGLIPTMRNHRVTGPDALIADRGFDFPQ